MKWKELEKTIESGLDEISKLPNVEAHRLREQLFLVEGKRKYKEKKCCDYIVDTGIEIFYFDAKATKQKRFSFGAKTGPIANQVAKLTKLKKMGRRTGFVIWFYEEDPARVNVRFIEDFTKTATIESGVRFGMDIFLAKERGEAGTNSYWNFEAGRELAKYGRI